MVVAVSTAPAVSDQRSAPKANDTSAVLSAPEPDPSSDCVSEPSHEASTIVSTSATNYTKAPPPAILKSFGIFMGWMGRHCPCRGCSVPAPKPPWTGRAAAAIKGVTDAPQETEGPPTSLLALVRRPSSLPSRDRLKYGRYTGGGRRSRQGF